MELLVGTLYDQLLFLGTDNFLTPAVCMIRACQQLIFFSGDMLGSNFVSLRVVSPLALGTRLFVSGCSTWTA